eukprot:3160811-Rhodomonas_salina.1
MSFAQVPQFVSAPQPETVIAAQVMLTDELNPLQPDEQLGFEDNGALRASSTTISAESLFGCPTDYLSKE